jgi:hypothetical protein
MNMATPAEHIPAVAAAPAAPAAPALTAEQAVGKIRMIGIAGKAGAGKSALADYISARYGAKVMAVADPIKAILNAIFGFPVSAWDDRKWKETAQPMIGHSPRVLAQSLGTDWGRALVEDIWISKLVAKWRQSEAALTCVPDIRFDNEAVFLMRNGGMIIKVEREGVPDVAGHSSEVGIQDQLVHLTIQNNGTIEELGESFDRAIVDHVLSIEQRMAEEQAQNAVSQ